MDFIGLTRKYPVNRRLTEKEREFQLRQKVRLNIEPHYQLSVIRMNSNFLESVDKWFAWKGVLSGVATTVLIIMTTFYVGMLHVTFTRDVNAGGVDNDLSVMTMVTLMMLPVAAYAIWTLLKELFAYTHYPILLDRKNRKVHVFKTNGSVVSASWNEIFFTLGELAHGGEWEIRGHILAPDKDTVLETFAFSYAGSLSTENISSDNNIHSDADYVHAHWEFIRRYMEDGPRSLSRQSQYCMPVDGRREKASVSIERVFANFASVPKVLYWMLFPLCAVISLFRMLAIRTSKIPRWPEEVEASCAVELNDPYAIKGTVEGERIAEYPAAALAAGVRFARASYLDEGGTAD